MDREEQIQEIINDDINNDEFIRKVCHIAATTEDDLLRGIARAWLQENSIKMMTRLLDRLDNKLRNK